MLDVTKITPEDFSSIKDDERNIEDLSESGLTYIQDVWKRFTSNRLSITGLIILLLVLFFALFGNFLSPKNYYTQELSFSNIPPVLTCYTLNDGTEVYIHKEYTLYEISNNGEILQRYTPIEDNKAQRIRVYKIGDNTVSIDYSNSAKKVKLNKEGKRKEASLLPSFIIKENNQQINNAHKRWNKSYILGTDYLGRDLYSRLISGLQVSMLVSIIACFVQLIIGIVYGGIAGFFGGRTDNIMMRIVDIISTVPLTLYVILLMVILQPGLNTIIIALASVYWVDMARQVRGQVLSIKNQEFVLAAKAIGTRNSIIIKKHLIPNAMGAIIVTLAVSIPSAVFTESFLSFIGLGVNAPSASLGTLCNDALGGLRTYPYQLFLPAVIICVLVLGFNFLGDGLRDALDPKLRK